MKSVLAMRVSRASARETLSWLGGAMGGIVADVGAGIAGAMRCVYDLRVDAGLPTSYASRFHLFSRADRAYT